MQSASAQRRVPDRSLSSSFRYDFDDIPFGTIPFDLPIFDGGLVITQTADALGIADMSARLLAGTLLEHPSVIHRRVKHVEITASPAMGFNVDGEMDTAEKVTCTIHPAALRMIVGPEYPHPTRT